MMGSLAHRFVGRFLAGLKCGYELRDASQDDIHLRVLLPVYGPAGMVVFARGGASPRRLASQGDTPAGSMSRPVLFRA